MNSPLKSTIAFALLSACLLAPGLSQGQKAVDLKVTGSIKPSACAVVIGGGSVFDYGSLSTDTISDERLNSIGARSRELTVTCKVATKFAINVTDNRIGSAPADTGTGQGYDFGLGAPKLGSYTVGISGFLYEGLLDVLTETTPDTWVKEYSTFKADGSQRKSLTSWDSMVPGAYTELTGLLTVDPTINRLSEFDVRGGIHLDGSATLEISYL